MQSQVRCLTSLFRTVSFAVIAALVMMLATVPAWAQNSVPPTAVQAAKMPEFASRLAHPVKRPGPPTSPALGRAKMRPGPLQANDIYDNGPTNGNTDAWTINFGFIVSDSFNVTGSNATVTGMSFAAWMFPGDVLSSAEVSITSSENGGTSYFDQTVNFTQSGCTGNEFGYNVCTQTASFNGPTLNAGTYWVNLQNASVPSGDPVYWDENSGPSSASDNTVGPIPSESFTILGGGSTCDNRQISDEAPVAQARVVSVPPSPAQTFQVIYNFTGAADGGSPQNGLAMDAAGNLYGTTTAGGGPSGTGTVFKLTPGASSWRFTRLYAFSGTDGAFPNTKLAVARDGTVYGTTAAGGSGGDGVLFRLSPPGHVLPVLAGWIQRLHYGFTGFSDGGNPQGDIVLDDSSNIYGTAYGGGTNGDGTVYEFTNGGIQVLHTFSGSPGDGANPYGVISGRGGLYGITRYGGSNGAGTLYTLAGGYQVIHNFASYAPEGNPISLAADQAGNLYGTSNFVPIICFPYGGDLYELSYPDWNIETLLILGGNGGRTSSWVSTDASGNVYGTADNIGAYGQGDVFKLTCCWTYTSLHDFSGGDGAQPSGSTLIDAQGNIYGTTSGGGAYGYGVVWEISP